MDRNQYLQQFKRGIHIFEEAYQQQKVLELDEKINQLLKKKKTEEEALKQLGSVEEVIQQVYQENHVKYQKDRQKVEKLKKKGLL